MPNKEDSTRRDWLEGGAELRQFPRVRVEGTLISNPVPGELVDTSQTGLGIRSTQPLNVGARNTFYIRKGDTRARFLGEVRWCQIEDTRYRKGGDIVPVYRSGVVLEWPNLENAPPLDDSVP